MLSSCAFTFRFPYVLPVSKECTHIVSERLTKQGAVLVTVVTWTLPAVGKMRIKQLSK